MYKPFRFFLAAFSLVTFFAAAISLNEGQATLPLFVAPLFRQGMLGFLLCLAVGACADIQEQIQTASRLANHEFRRNTVLDCTLFTVLSLTTGLAFSGAVMVLTGSLARHGLIANGGREFWGYMAVSVALLGVIVERHFRYFVTLFHRIAETHRMTGASAGLDTRTLIHEPPLKRGLFYG